MPDVKSFSLIDSFGLLGVPPAVTPEMEPYWQAAETGVLVVERCDNCGLHGFPLRQICRRCNHRSMSVAVVQPPGVLYSYTVNRHPWTPDMGPYPLGIVEFPGLDGNRFVGLLAGFAEEPRIGDHVDFGFRASEAINGLSRLFFMPWNQQQ